MPTDYTGTTPRNINATNSIVLVVPICAKRFAGAIFFFRTHSYFPASGRAVVTGVVPFSARFLPSIFIAHRVQQSHCSSVFHRVLLLTHAIYTYIYIFFFCSHFYFPASGQAVVTGVVPSPPWFLPSIFIAHRVQQSHCSSIFHRVLLNHALALSASQFMHKKSPNEFRRVCSRRGLNSRN